MIQVKAEMSAIPLLEGELVCNQLAEITLHVIGRPEEINKYWKKMITEGMLDNSD